ncbi:hypothetical protein K504DRAFT_508151 [Pleomassaria siparia CBS 279.74]|uniref:Rhodopsin domain-containing protein n=1 Tax=Pleomassaria siparia CBS 279.74 TaxID=1314801 RepID=A0A6G1JSL2_9PLEO|nr:hypothetical protein K504DRAFT_508151 [Pleomassaria siparia CBS 279.74]
MSFNPYPGQEHDLRNIPIALTTLAVTLVTARLVTTFKNIGWLGVEDAFMVASSMCLVVFCIILSQASKYGFGKHLVDIKKTGGDVDKAFLWYYLSQIAYKSTITFNKLAFLFLYLRIFSINWFRKMSLTMIYIVIASGIAFVTLSTFQCTPVKKAWLKSAVAGHCVSLPWHRWTWTAFNLSTDLVIFTMPMPVIYRLQMSLGKRIGLAFIFLIGFFICLTTGLRIKTVVRAAQAKEQTWESCPANLWSFIEAAVGVICACLVSLRKMLTACFPDGIRKSKNSDCKPGSGSSSKRSGPAPGSQKLDDLNVTEYALETMSSPEGQLWGASDTRVNAGTLTSESQENIVEPRQVIMVRREVSVRRDTK